MAIVAGAQGTGGTQAIASFRRKVNMKDGLAELEPDINPLLLFLRKTAKGSIKDPKWNWLEHDRFGDTVQASGTHTDSDTTINVDDATLGAPEMLVRNQRTDEVVRIGAIGSATTWTGCTRSVGATAAAAMLDDDYFTILGTSFAENSSTPTPRSKAATTGFNYTQIFRDTFGASGTLIQTDLYGANKIMNERAAQSSREHQLFLEKTLWFGEQSEVTSGTFPVRTLGGVDEFATQTYDFGGSFSMQAAFDALEVGMRYGSNSKMLFCSRGTASNISLEALDKVRNTDSTKTFGINISMLESPHGKVAIVRHDLLVGNQYGKRSYLLDMKNFRYLFLRGRDTALYEGLETNGTDGEIHGFLTECTLERMHATTHQVWLNTNT